MRFFVVKPTGCRLREMFLKGWSPDKVNIKIALIADLHYDTVPSVPKRRGEIADILLLRTVHRLNRMIKPDITVVLGDLLDRGDDPDAARLQGRLRQVLDVLESPVIVLPGNHDADVDAFYRDFERPPDFVDIKGYRLVPFLDPEEPDWNARRTECDLERMRRLRGGFDGPIVALQHVPVFPPGMSECPYNYTNADEVIAAMRANAVNVALSGHYHEGMDLVRHDRLVFLAGPALCELPFAFLEVDLDGEDVRVRRHELRMNDALGLVDAHIHTQFAYCSENMDIGRAMKLCDDFGLAGFGFSEHAEHLYFDLESCRSGEGLKSGIESAREEDDRVGAYFEAARDAECPRDCVGFEVDVDFNGKLLIREEDRARAAYLIGSVHVLRELYAGGRDLDKACDEFLSRTERILAGGIRVLAHPLRVFRRAKVRAPESVFEPLVKLLLRYGAAAEINFHTNEPPPAFVKLCLDAGVKLALGTDAHNLCEVGEFAPHLALLESVGFNGELKDILIDPRRT